MTLRFWINAFIPEQFETLMRRIERGPYAGKTVIPGPVDWFNDCYLTENRHLEL